MIYAENSSFVHLISELENSSTVKLKYYCLLASPSSNSKASNPGLGWGSSSSSSCCEKRSVVNRETRQGSQTESQLLLLVHAFSLRSAFRALVSINGATCFFVPRHRRFQTSIASKGFPSACITAPIDSWSCNRFIIHTPTTVNVGFGSLPAETPIRKHS